LLLDKIDVRTLHLATLLGNGVVNGVYEGYMPAGVDKPIALASRDAKDEHVRTKYEKSHYLSKHVLSQMCATPQLQAAALLAAVEDDDVVTVVGLLAVGTTADAKNVAFARACVLEAEMLKKAKQTAKQCKKVLKAADSAAAARRAKASGSGGGDDDDDGVGDVDDEAAPSPSAEAVAAARRDLATAHTTLLLASPMRELLQLNGAAVPPPVAASKSFDSLATSSSSSAPTTLSTSSSLPSSSSFALPRASIGLSFASPPSSAAAMVALAIKTPPLAPSVGLSTMAAQSSDSLRPR
jgi:hypothetical protein